MDIKKLSATLERWKINKTMLAELSGVPKGTLGHILSGTKYYNFTSEQEEKVKDVLKEMSEDIKKVVK